MFLAEHDSRGPLAMGERLSAWTPSCNGSVRVELSGQRTTSDSGALLLREALDNSGVIEALEDNLIDRRHPLRVRHSLASQLRTLVLQRAMGWIDLSDTDMLRRDPLWQLACSDARGMTPLDQDRPSQATLSRLLTCLGRDDNIDTVHEGLLRLVVWRLASLKHGERPKQLTVDIDGLPIEVHGHQGGSAFHGLYGARCSGQVVADTFIKLLPRFSRSPSACGSQGSSGAGSCCTPSRYRSRRRASL
ncbi:transposase, partial [Halomonas alkalicola]|uniref:transposase n=1 Tax=Halomonas alkalicola TaxID=1930622 RepID=UPI00406BD698